MLDIYPEFSREEKPRLIVPALLWFFAIVGMIVAALMLTGCAQTFQGICAVQPVGVTDRGIAVASVHCEAS